MPWTYRIYTCLHESCDHLDVLSITDDECDISSLHLYPQPEIQFRLTGFCGSCLRSRDLCNAGYQYSDASRIVPFARAFYSLKNRLDTEGIVSTELEGIFSKRDIELLKEVLRVLIADILWRGREGNDTDPSTADERAVAAEMNKKLFLALATRNEPTRPANLSPFLEAHIIPISRSPDNQTCCICYDEYGQLNDKGRLVTPVKYSCNHWGICYSCARNSLSVVDGHINGALCHYRCSLEPIARVKGEEDALDMQPPTGFLLHISLLLQEYEADIQGHRADHVSARGNQGPTLNEGDEYDPTEFDDIPARLFVQATGRVPRADQEQGSPNTIQLFLQDSRSPDYIDY